MVDVLRDPQMKVKRTLPALLKPAFLKRAFGGDPAPTAGDPFVRH